MMYGLGPESPGFFVQEPVKLDYLMSKFVEMNSWKWTQRLNARNERNEHNE